jgi:hypothetical protein
VLIALQSTIVEAIALHEKRYGVIPRPAAAAEQYA